jgi:ribosomal protein S18 acetylase RimI-like enzyme
MEIIKAETSHIPAIIELWKEFADYHRGIEPVYTRTEDAGRIFGEHIKKLMESGDSQVLIALDKEEVVAYSIAQISKRPALFDQTEFGFISDLGVRSDYRRKGVGEQVLSKNFEWFKSRKIERVELLVLSENTAAVSFWKKHGFGVYAHRMFLSQ